MPDQDLSENELPYPLFGDREVEQNARVVGWRVESNRECLVRLRGLPIHEMAADASVARDFGDRIEAGQGFEGQLLSVQRPKAMGSR
ncbi:MAG: hypothetical protein ACYS8L_08880 [Planctomycetota bacterium]